MPTREQLAGYPEAVITPHRRAEINLYETLRATPVRPWRGPDTAYESVLWLDATTWESYSLFDSPALPHDGEMTREECLAHSVDCPGANFFYTNKTLPVSYQIPTALSQTQEGVTYFDAPVVIPVLTELLVMSAGVTQLTWMSLTPGEVLTQKAGIAMATGRVVVGGLGLGWLLKEVAAKPEVTEIVVVERNARLLAWLRPVLTAKFPAVAAKVVTWVSDDVYLFMASDLTARRHAAVTYLLDIWPRLGDADFDALFSLYETLLGPKKIWGWGRGTTTPAFS